MPKQPMKVVVFLLGISLFFALAASDVRSSEVQIQDTFTLLKEGINDVLNVLPWHHDPPEDCTCPDHEKMCGGGMHGDMGDCVEGCPMDMGSCEMMGDCHGGGAPVKSGVEFR